jgi:hypothetical protein
MQSCSDVWEPEPYRNSILLHVAASIINGVRKSRLSQSGSRLQSGNEEQSLLSEFAPSLGFEQWTKLLPPEAWACYSIAAPRARVDDIYPAFLRPSLVVGKKYPASMTPYQPDKRLARISIEIFVELLPFSHLF